MLQWSFRQAERAKSPCVLRHLPLYALRAEGEVGLALMYI